MPTDVIKFYCPNCDKRLGVRVEEMHLNFVCPKCNRKIRFSQDALPEERLTPPCPMNATTIVQGQETGSHVVTTQPLPKEKPLITLNKTHSPFIKKQSLDESKEAPMPLKMPELTTQADNHVAPKRKFIIPKKH